MENASHDRRSLLLVVCLSILAVLATPTNLVVGFFVGWGWAGDTGVPLTTSQADRLDAAFMITLWAGGIGFGLLILTAFTSRSPKLLRALRIAVVITLFAQVCAFIVAV